MHIKQYYIDYMSSLCHELENCLRRFYRPDCRLSLFGSAGNGFGLLGSDADLCLRFGPEVKPEVFFFFFFFGIFFFVIAGNRGVPFRILSSGMVRQ